MALMQRFESVMKDIQQETQRVNWREKKIYANWLAQSYYFVRHSTRLLATSASHTNFNQENFHRRLGAHFNEEKGHEDLALTDLKKLGFSIDQFPELDANKLFYRNQYFGSERITPYYIMGYILFLEGFAVYQGPKILKEAMDSYGERCSNFIRVHVEEDEGHLEDAFKQIEMLKEEEKRSVLESLHISFRLYKEVLENLNMTINEIKPTFI